MTTFTKSEQTAHRKAYIDECRQKAWGAACHAEWIFKGLERVVAHYTKLQEEDRQLEGDIKALETALDYHTVENRNKRKAMQERRTGLARQCEEIGNSARQGQQAMQDLLASVETHIALAKHAEDWEWKEIDAKPEEPAAEAITK